MSNFIKEITSEQDTPRTHILQLESLVADVSLGDTQVKKIIQLSLEGLVVVLALWLQQAQSMVKSQAQTSDGM